MKRFNKQDSLKLIDLIYQYANFTGGVDEGFELIDHISDLVSTYREVKDDYVNFRTHIRWEGDIWSNSPKPKEFVKLDLSLIDDHIDDIIEIGRLFYNDPEVSLEYKVYLRLKWGF